MTIPRFRLHQKHYGRLMPLSLVTLLAAVCLAFSPAASSAASSPQTQVRAAWAQLKSSIVNRSPSAFCGILSAHASSQLIADVRAKPRPTSCKDESPCKGNGCNDERRQGSDSERVRRADSDDAKARGGGGVT